jgi:phosphoribulokinase
MNSLRHSLARSLSLAICMIGSLAAGCTTTTTQSFVVNKDSQVEASYVATDANFEKYDRLMATDMGIFFPPDAGAPIEDQQRTRQIFREAFLGRLGGYLIVTDKGPTALEVQATLIDYRSAGGGAVPAIRSDLEDMAVPGTLLFLMELKDSESGRVLARAADSATAVSFSTSAGTTTDWVAVEAAAARWATLFREFLDDNLNQ